MTDREIDFKNRLNLPTELDDFKEVLLQAARSGKYPPNNWLEKEGSKQDRSSQYNSISHHINKVLMGIYVDEDSGLDHRLHAACRLMMDYTRSKRGIVHPIDQKKSISNDTRFTESYINEAIEAGKQVPHSTPFMQNYLNNTMKYKVDGKQVSREEYYDLRAKMLNHYLKGLD